MQFTIAILAFAGSAGAAAVGQWGPPPPPASPPPPPPAPTPWAGWCTGWGPGCATAVYPTGTAYYPSSGYRPSYYYPSTGYAVAAHPTGMPVATGGAAMPTAAPALLGALGALVLMQG